jgi:lambda family phage portal protein
LELIEAERIADHLDTSGVSPSVGNQHRMGIEVDRFFRPVAYFIRQRHPSEIRFSGIPDEIEKVPADQIIHLALVDRWPQTRGEPWLHTAARKLNDMDSYSEAELDRARTQACSVGAIESPEDTASFGETQADGTVEMNLEPGTYHRLNPGEKLNALAPTSPNPALEPFMRHMLREVAAGAGVSYESLSRDYSQSNYSSSRLALLDDRDLWRYFQSWFICDFRKHIHREWLRSAVIVGAIPEIAIREYANDPMKFEAVRFKPRGWSWIDPTKEVEAYEKAIKDGFMTVSDVIAQTAGGADIEDVLDVREQELVMMKEKGLVFETSPEFYVEPDEEPPPEPEAEMDEAEDPAERRVFRLRRKQ